MGAYALLSVSCSIKHNPSEQKPTFPLKRTLWGYTEVGSRESPFSAICEQVLEQNGERKEGRRVQRC